MLKIVDNNFYLTRIAVAGEVNRFPVHHGCTHRETVAGSQTSIVDLCYHGYVAIVGCQWQGKVDVSVAETAFGILYHRRIRTIDEIRRIVVGYRDLELTGNEIALCIFSIVAYDGNTALEFVGSIEKIGQRSAWRRIQQGVEVVRPVDAAVWIENTVVVKNHTAVVGRQRVRPVVLAFAKQSFRGQGVVGRRAGNLRAFGQVVVVARSAAENFATAGVHNGKRPNGLCIYNTQLSKILLKIINVMAKSGIVSINTIGIIGYTVTVNVQTNAGVLDGVGFQTTLNNPQINNALITINACTLRGSHDERLPQFKRGMYYFKTTGKREISILGYGNAGDRHNVGNGNKTASGPGRVNAILRDGTGVIG